MNITTNRKHQTLGSFALILLIVGVFSQFKTLGGDNVVLIVSLAMLFTVGYYLIGNALRTALLCLMISPSLFLASEATTQFLTCDETYMIRELEDTRVFNYRQWNMGGYRTSILVTGTAAKALQKISIGAEPPQYMLHGLIKAVHWLVGFSILLILFEVMRRNFVAREHHQVFFVAFFIVSLLIPTNILAFKVANYDLLSVMLGLVTLALALASVRNQSLKLALSAVGMGALASQEKIIASPFFALAMFFAVFIALTWQKTSKGSDQQATKSIPWLRALGVLALSMVIASLTVGITWSFVNSIHGGLRFSLPNALNPLTGYLSVTGTTSASSSSAFVLASLAIYALAIVASFAYRFVGHKVRNISLQGKFPVITAVVIVVLVGLGIYSTYAYPVYVHPYHLTPQGIYLPTKSFNDATTHYMQPSFSAHLVAATISSYSVIANGLPTFVWLFLIVAPIAELLTKKSLVVPHGWSLAALLVMLFPLAYAVTQTPLGARYLNIFLFVIALFVVLMATSLLAELKPQYRIATGTVCALLLFGELFMFRPVIGAFTPFWNKPDREFADKPLYGQGRAGHWAGWGEEIFLAGSIIVAEYKQPGKSVTIHASYPGDWLTGDTSVTIVPYNQFERGISPSDFYVLSRQAIYQKRYPFPHGQKPLFTIDYGGATMAWVFRGDQLRNTIMFAAPEKQGGYITEVPEIRNQANDATNLQRSSLVVYEDGKPLGPSNSAFDDIRKIGKGRFNHWEDVVFFSTSDNSDPRTNGRRYTFQFQH